MNRTKVFQEMIDAAEAGISVVETVKGMIDRFTGEEIEAFFRATGARLIKHQPGFLLPDSERFSISNHFVAKSPEYPNLAELLSYLYQKMNRTTYKNIHVKYRQGLLMWILEDVERFRLLTKEQRMEVLASILDTSVKYVTKNIESENLFDRDLEPNVAVFIKGHFPDK